ncbi:hypothetical protein NC651_008166 [Populus alba x Populus x berolinensis]|nr:hypothetical protein NC651_008166 [Populus alba x Populus x berolinensis]
MIGLGHLKHWSVMNQSHQGGDYCGGR